MSNQTFIDYFLEFRNVPEEWEEAKNFFNWYLTQSTNFLNAKSSGIYSSTQSPSGKQLYLSSTAYDVLRLTINFGALPNAATKTYAHGIDFSSGFRLFNLYLAANDTTAQKGFCLQYYSVAAGDIVISINSTNIVVTTLSDYSFYNDCYVIVEFLLGVQ